MHASRFPTATRSLPPQRARGAIQRRQRLTLALAVMLCPAIALAADSAPDRDAPDARPAVATTAPSAGATPFARFDRLKEQGNLIGVPPIADTVLADAGGFRSRLADRDLGFMLISLNSAAYDLHAPPRTQPQRYNGQRPTGNSTQQFLFTYDLGQHGNDQSQLVAGVVFEAASWEPLGPRTTGSLSRLAYFRTFNNRQWELKIGYLSNALEYIGVYTGGSLAGGAQGPNAIIPFQVGLSRLPMASPGMNLTFNGADGFYNKLGLQRSMSPDGAQAEVERNSHGLRFRTPGSGLLVIDEIGLKRAASVDQNHLWLRGGFIHNASDYARFEHATRSDSNTAYYLAGDVQISRGGSGLPFHGWYVGASVHDAPQDRNLYTRYYEARVYQMGPFATRPYDMVSLTYSHSEFSEDAARLYARRGIATASDTSAATVSYMARVHRGAYLSTGLSYITNPTFAPRTADALNLMLGLNMFF